MLTHVGLKRLQARRAAGLSLSADEARLADLARRGAADLEERQAAALRERGWARVAPAALPMEEIRLLYRRNPLEHVSSVNFEITNRCNFACRHCRNEGVEAATEPDVSRLVEAARLFLSLGIRRFDFIGGEVTRYGNGWLELAQAISRMDRDEAWPQPLVVSVYTNGWWLGLGEFEAAGRTHAGESEYLRALARHGVTHVLFSIDGPEALHDDWRGHPGLFRRILDGLPRVAAAGLAPRLSVVAREDEPLDHLRPLAQAIYGAGDGSLERLAEDPTNHFSSLVDVGRGARLRRGSFALEGLDPGLLRCKAFFRPEPALHVRAGGEVGICPLMHGGEGYGSVHDRPLVDILNGLHEAPLYRLHASGRIGRYLDRIPRETFGERFDHLCAVRVAANRVALAEARSRRASRRVR